MTSQRFDGRREGGNYAYPDREPAHPAYRRDTLAPRPQLLPSPTKGKFARELLTNISYIFFILLENRKTFG